MVSGESGQGSSLNLPELGVGAMASTGTRAVAFVVDLMISALIAFLFTHPELPKNWSLLVWAAMTVVGVGVFGSTPGQALLGIRVASLRGKSVIGAWAFPRTALTFLIVPALLLDADGRGLHDRWCRTVVVRFR